MASGNTEMSFLGGSSCYFKKCVFDCFKNKKKFKQFFEKRNTSILFVCEFSSTGS